MIKNNSSALKVVIGFLILIICQSCDPYNKRRIPLGNSPYINCKNCKRSTVSEINQSESPAHEYEFLSAEDLQVSEPLPATLSEKEQTSDSKKQVNPKANIRKKGSLAHRNVKSKNLIKSTDKAHNKPTSTSKSSKKSNFIPLAKMPQKKYSVEQQKVMLDEKNSNIKDLSNKAKGITIPKPKADILEAEQAIAAPTREEQSKLYEKLKELQEIEREASDNSLSKPQHQAIVPQQLAIAPQPQATAPQPQATASQPQTTTTQQQATALQQEAIVPQQQKAPQPQQQAIAPQQEPKTLQQQTAPQQQTLPSQQTVPALQQKSNDKQKNQLDRSLMKSNSKSPVAQYDLKNKPIPLLD